MGITIYPPTSGGGGVWGSITGTLSSQTDLNSALSGKQATLVSGTNIRTINSTSILGTGDISVSAGADTIQTKTASSESAGSVDLSLGHWLELNCDADFSFSIIDTTKITAGYIYKVDCKNTKSPSGVVTGSIPTGWWSNVGSSLPLATGESAPAFLTKNSAGAISILFGIQQVV